MRRLNGLNSTLEQRSVGRGVAGLVVGAGLANSSAVGACVSQSFSYHATVLS